MKRKEIQNAIQNRERLAYRVAEVSTLVGIPASTIRSMIRDGEINPVTGFKTWLITAEDVEKLLDKRLR